MPLPLTSPRPFAAALRRMDRALLPTPLRSAEIAAQIELEIQERSFFSATNMYGSVLEKFRDGITDLLNPRTEFRADPVTGELRPFTAGKDRATLRLEIKQELTKYGYVPPEELAGTIQDLSSDLRINLVIDHNETEAAAYGHHLQSVDEDFADAFPAQELVRFEQRQEPRDWDAIWESAAAEAGDEAAGAAFRRTGRKAARKDSAVWLAISDFKRPWPPFKFGSGMGLRDLNRREAIDLGLISRDDRIALQRRAFNDQLPEAA